MSTGHPTRGYTLRPGFSGTSATGIAFRVSRQGFRSPEVAVPKPPGTRRVLVLGDSVAWGAGVREEETFSRRLEAALRDELACPVEVVDAAVSGYGSVEEADVLEHEGLGFEPDVVLVFHVENDNWIVRHVQGRTAAFLKEHVLYRSYLVTSVLQAVRTVRWRVGAREAGGDAAAYAKSQREWAQAPGTAESLAALRRIAAVASEHGARVVLASYPNNLRDPALDESRNGALQAIAAETGMAFVDTGPTLVAHRDRGLSVSERDLHPNAYAHGLIADALLPTVRAALDCASRSGPVS